ncbi:MAG: hypothetical protein GX787_02250 [Tissierellia bacterium]|nr:hypothetical protein [Tissierellia bacterium]
MSKYEVKGKTTQFSATSRISFSMQDNKRKDIWYAIEYTEVRDLPDVEGIVVEEEKKALWDAVDKEVGTRFGEIVTNHKKQFG